MPYLNTNELIHARLFPAIRDGAHWVFLSDCDRGHTEISRLLLALTALGHDSDFGSVPFVNVPTGHQATIHFLAVAKGLLSREQVSGFLRSTGWYQGELPEGRDILSLPAGDGSVLAIFVWAVEHGHLRDAPPVEAN